MASRHAACSCGRLRLDADGEPVRISVCHCLACQRRTGSAFGAQARFPADRVRIAGDHAEYVRVSDDGEERRFHFCPECGGTVFYTTEAEENLIAVPLGAFADPAFPRPTISFYQWRRHPWVGLADAIERDDMWESLRPLYESGEYAEAADRGHELVGANPAALHLAYNVACCESLAGRTADAIDHLRVAVEGSEELRRQAAADSDLDAIRGEPAFRELVGER